LVSVGARKPIKPKKACCKSGPRCERCPVVCKRLVKQGLASKEDGRIVLAKDTRKKDVKAARAR
jgi:hypothetical protein